MIRRLLLATAVMLPSAALAAPIETVVVTAAPPDPVGNAAFSVVTLDTADIRSTTELDRALAQVPGLSLFRRDSSLSANPTTQGLSLRAIAPSLEEIFTRATANAAGAESKEGRLVMFPSWLRHHVPANDGTTERISIAFNLMFEQFAETMAAPMWNPTAGNKPQPFVPLARL